MHLQDDHGGGDGQAAVLHRDGLAGQGVFIAAVGQGDGHSTRTARQGEHAHGQVLPILIEGHGYALASSASTWNTASVGRRFLMSYSRRSKGDRSSPAVQSMGSRSNSEGV